MTDEEVQTALEHVGDINIIVKTRQWVELKSEVKRLTADLEQARAALTRLEQAASVFGVRVQTDAGRSRGQSARSGASDDLLMALLDARAALASGER